MSTLMHFLQNIDVVCMPKPGDFTHSEAKSSSSSSSRRNSPFRSPSQQPSQDLDLEHKCYVTGWGRRTECKFIHNNNLIA